MTLRSARRGKDIIDVGDSRYSFSAGPEIVPDTEARGGLSPKDIGRGFGVVTSWGDEASRIALDRSCAWWGREGAPSYDRKYEAVGIPDWRNLFWAGSIRAHVYKR